MAKYTVTFELEVPEGNISEFRGEHIVPEIESWFESLGCNVGDVVTVTEVK